MSNPVNRGVLCIAFATGFFCVFYAIYVDYVFFLLPSPYLVQFYLASSGNLEESQNQNFLKKQEAIFMEKAAYSVKEIMKLTGLGRNLVYELINDGKLKAVRAGEKRILIPAWALEEFLKKAN